MTPKPHPAEDDAYKRLQDFTRRVLAVPKKEVDQKIAAEKAARKKSGKRS
jgi:hypothetical protein